MGVYSTTSRYTGLSGIDTESMVQAMMKAETMKYDNLKKTRQRTTWKQEAYKAQVNAINAFQKSFLDLLGTNSLRNSKSFVATTATVSLAGAASKAVTIKSGAPSGTYQLSIEQLATKDTYTGAQVHGEGITGSTALNVNNLKAGDTFRLTLDGRNVDLTFSQEELDTAKAGGNDKFLEVMNTKLQKAFGSDSNVNKVQASFTSSGALSFTTNGNHTLTVSEGAGRKVSQTANSAANYNAIATAPGGEYSFKITTGTSTKTINFNVNDVGNDTLTNEDKLLTAIRSALGKEGVNNVGVSYDENNKLVFSALGTTEDIVISDAGGALGLSGNQMTLEPTSVLGYLGGIKNGASNTIDTGKTLKDVFGSGVGDTIKFTINNKDFAIDSSMSIKDFMSEVNKSSAGVTLSFDAISETFKLEGNQTGAVNAITFTDTDGFLASGLGINAAGSKHAEATDAKFTLNGKEYVRESNDVTVGGISMTLNEVTSSVDGDGQVNKSAVKIEVAKDTSKVFDLIKSFVDAYNNLIAGMNGAVNQTRAKNSTYNYYEPLTDDQKSAMSDKQIEEWETKAKRGTLYRDSTLSSITSSMRSALYSAVDLGNGQKISLYEIGITTSPNVSDQGKLVIDEDKLRAAIESRGEDIGELFTQSKNGLAERMNTIVNNAIGSNGSLTKKVGSEFYATTLTDNELYKLMKRQDEQLADMLITLRRKEDSYYTKFSKMEQAVSSSNSQMSYLQSMMG